jgi:putative acetyltransferase
MTLAIAVEDPAQSEIARLLEDAEAYSASLYPAESNHHLPIEALRAPNVRFLVGRDAAGRATATGAVMLHDGWAELKCMWVVPDARGTGASKAILAALEATALQQGVGLLRLETGIANHAALRLYARSGFVARGPFADYRPDPLSVFMEKLLDPRKI